MKCNQGWAQILGIKSTTNFYGEAESLACVWSIYIPSTPFQMLCNWHAVLPCSVQTWIHPAFGVCLQNKLLNLTNDSFEIPALRVNMKTSQDTLALQLQ